ncbi:MAG: N-acetylmuramoyl-L-alanine amidase [Bacteroidota bacterium]
MRTVVIDAGHGGRDFGCSHHHKHEKHLALNIALRLGKMISDEYPTVKVIYTRTRDVFVPLHKRAEIANHNNADLFISIHCNSIPNADHIHGSETYVMGLHRAKDNLAVAKRENEVILFESDYHKHYEGFDPNSAEGHIILSMFQNAYLEQSIRFAELVEKNIRNRTGRKSRGVKQAGFLVLRETTMPSVLIETAYLSNLNDNRFLASNYGQYSMAQAIFHGFREYKAEMENQPVTAFRPKAQVVKEELPSPGLVNSLPTRDAGALTSKGVPADFAAARPAPTASPKANGRKTMSQMLITNSRSSTQEAKVENAAASIVFKVQLAVSADHIPANSSYWQKADYPIEVKKQQSLFKYLAVGFKDYAEASRAKKKLRENGFQEAFVVAYQGGKRISIEQARQLEN